MDLVTFGEAMVRLTPPGFQRLEQARSLDVSVGGAELNVAVAAARLGLETRWVSRLPENALGRLIAGRAREHGVDVSHVMWTPEERVGLYFAELGAAPRAGTILYDRAGSAASRIAPGMIDWDVAFKGASWFHTSGITPALSESAAATVMEGMAAAKSAGLTVSYDPNYRASLWSAERAREVQGPLLRHVDVLIAGHGAARLVFDSPPRAGQADDPAALASMIQERFNVPVVAITTRDEHRSWQCRVSAVARVGDVLHHGPCYDVEPVDRIGAGDAFAAGLITGRIRREDWDTAVRSATALCALKHTVPGDFSQATPGDIAQLVDHPAVRLIR